MRAAGPGVQPRETGLLLHIQPVGSDLTSKVRVGRDLPVVIQGEAVGYDARRASNVPGRSEEHTSELQSIMRISYGVFCLQQKKATKQLMRELVVTTNHI